MRRVVVTGSSGMLGTVVCELFARDSHVVGLDVDATASGGPLDALEVDITDASAVREAFDHTSPEVVVHCAAIVDVDGAENDYSSARAVNALGTRNVARHTPRDSHFVYISTDSVFDGRRGGYVETDLPCPVNNYAKTKLEGEWFAQLEAERHLVVRTNFIGRSSAGKGSLATWVVDALSSGDEVRLATDWVFSPAYVDHVAETIRDLVGVGATGLLHGSGSAACSKYEFGVTLAEEFGLDASAITPVTFRELDFAAPRPRDASLDCTKAASLLGRPLPDYREGIRALREAWS